jgi:hypothetical protein
MVQRAGRSAPGAALASVATAPVERLAAAGSADHGDLRPGHRLEEGAFRREVKFGGLASRGAGRHVLSDAEDTRSDDLVGLRIKKKLRLAAASGQSDRRLSGNVGDIRWLLTLGMVAIARNTAASADGGAAAAAAFHSSWAR